MMKKTLKILVSLCVAIVVGGIIGVLISGVFVVIFKDVSWSEYFHNIISSTSSDVGMVLKTVGFMVLWMVVSSVLHLILHEVGHLVAGLLTGYRFVSFRVFSLTLIKKDGHFQFRRFSLGQAIGQCLMAPPDRPLDEIDTRWYNLGGVLANLIVVVFALLACLLADLPMWAETWMIMLILTGLFFVFTNGWPMKVGGIPNDGYNLKSLERSSISKQLLCYILQVNASIQEGLQPKELPESLFNDEGDVDWGDGIQANWQMMVVARMENLHQWEEAYTLLSEALNHKDIMPALFVQEFAIEMIFVCLVTDRKEEARQYYTPELQKYIQNFARTQSGKQRILFAINLLLEDNEEAADAQLQALKAQRHQYLLQGEVGMDIELMEWVRSRQ